VPDTLDVGDKAAIHARLLDRAREISPLIRGLAEEQEKNRRVSDAVMRAMCEADIHRALQPKRYGGYELDYSFLVDLCWEWGAQCASSAWVTSLLCAHQWLLGQFPIEAQDDVWRAAPDALFCGSYAPSGACERVPGGFRISGSWMFASGCDVSQWAFLSVRLPFDQPVPGFVSVPRGDWTIDDNWHTVGLCATGSKNLVCKDVFVPEHRHVTIPALAAGNAPGCIAHGTPLFRVPMLAAIPASISAPALGALRGAVADFVEATKVRTTRGAVVAGGQRMAEFAGVQTRIAEASAAVDASRLMLLRDLAETHAVIERGETVGVDMRIRNRLTHGYIVKQCVTGIDALWAAAGGMSIFSSNRIQRAWRDIHGVSKHVSFNWDAISTMYGQWALGLEPKGQY
jgi:alkylation response protein AidB-like acyl-CoA dehydrogenase